jgi:thiamine pyrophosphate-dependent acetolactate synthase large subunit-like protein
MAMQVADFVLGRLTEWGVHRIYGYPGDGINGLRALYCDDPGQVGKAWDEALASEVPVVLEFRTDPEVPPLPPHVMKDQAKKSVKARCTIRSGWDWRPGASGRSWPSTTRSSPAGTGSS